MRALMGWAVMVALAALGPAASAIEIREVQWGFNERVVLDRFNLLSVYVFNPADEPFDGQLSLSQSVGAPHIEPCYVSPRSGRWVHFYPYITSGFTNWTLSWGPRAGQSHRVSQPRPGEPALVLITDQRSLGVRAPGVRQFDAASFPPSVSGTESLGAAILDQRPAWDAARQQTLVDWVRLGGTLHLILDDTGNYPRLDGQMAVLDAPLDRHRVGAGQVLRHEVRRGELTPERLVELGMIDEPALAAGSTGSDDFERIDEHVIWKLSRMVQPTHAWGLIFLLTVVLLILVGPVHWIASRKWFDWRVSILSLLAVVALFSLVFYAIGQRGYGEVTSVHTIAYARPLEPGRWDLMQYGNAFVTRGGTYQISLRDSYTVLSAASSHEAVRGRIRNGRDGEFLVDMPLFSNRPFVARSQLAGPPLAMHSVRWNGDLDDLTLELGPLDGMTFIAGWAVSGDRAARLNPRVNVDNDSVHLRATASQRVYDLLGLQELNWYYGYHNYHSDYGPRDLDNVLQDVAQHVIAGQLGLRRNPSGGRQAAPAGDEDDRDSGHVKVLILTTAPPEFLPLGQGLSGQAGGVIWALDLFDADHRQQQEAVDRSDMDRSDIDRSEPNDGTHALDNGENE